MAFRATVLTLYPEMFPGHLGFSLAGKAAERDAAPETVETETALGFAGGVETGNDRPVLIQDLRVRVRSHSR